MDQPAASWLTRLRRGYELGANRRPVSKSQQFTILTQSRQECQEFLPFAVFAPLRETTIVKYCIWNCCSALGVGLAVPELHSSQLASQNLHQEVAAAAGRLQKARVDVLRLVLQYTGSIDSLYRLLMPSAILRVQDDTKAINGILEVSVVIDVENHQHFIGIR